MDKTEMSISNLFNLAWERNRSYSEAYLTHCKRWVQIAKNWTVTDFPMHLDIEIGSQCNLKCPMCMRNQLKMPNIQMTTRDWLDIIGEACSYKDLYAIKPNYRNEPTLNKDLPDMLQLGIHYGIKEIIMNTNGNFNHHLIPKIAKNLTEIAFSVDAFTEETYNKVRPGGNFNKVKENIRRFILARDHINQALRVRVAFVIQEANQHEAGDFLDFWKGQGVDKIVINECYDPGSKGNYDGIRTHWTQQEDFVCPQIFQRLVICSNGNVLPCCGSYDESLMLGNVFQEPRNSLYDIWHGPTMTYLRALHTTGRFKDNPTCRKCALTFKPDGIQERKHFTGSGPS